MKINSSTWNVTNTENLYKNIKQKLTEQPEATYRKQIQDSTAGKNELSSKHYQEKSAESVLTEKEIDTLRALFGENKKELNKSFYGRTKPQNVQSGYFLDVKG